MKCVRSRLSHHPSRDGRGCRGRGWSRVLAARESRPGTAFDRGRSRLSGPCRSRAGVSRWARGSRHRPSASFSFRDLDPGQLGLVPLAKFQAPRLVVIAVEQQPWWTVGVKGGQPGKALGLRKLSDGSPFPLANFFTSPNEAFQRLPSGVMKDDDGSSDDVSRPSLNDLPRQPAPWSGSRR